MAKPCTNETPCLVANGKGGHSPVCERLRAQGAKPRVVQRRPLEPARLSPPKLDVSPSPGAIGCGCGKVNVPDRRTPCVVDGVEHRYGLPCRRAAR